DTADAGKPPPEPGQAAAEPEAAAAGKGVSDAQRSERRERNAGPLARERPTASAPSIVIVQPPAAAQRDVVRIEVGPATVTLEFGGQKYRSPNRLDHGALAASLIDPEEHGKALFRGIVRTEPSLGGSADWATALGYGAAMRDGQRGLCFELS